MKNTLFLDTNVVLDLLGERVPFYEDAAKIATLADNKVIEIVVSALSFSTVYYLLCRFESKQTVIEKLSKFKILITTSDLTNQNVDKGLLSDFSDFEDALQYFNALDKNCDIIITRNVKDFKTSKIPVLTPSEYLNSILK